MVPLCMPAYQISKDSTIAEIIGHYPYLVDVLVGEYGFHCVGCFASEFETLAEGAVVHGLNDEELEELIQTLVERVQQQN